MSHDMLFFLLLWRTAWYAYLLFHSAKSKAWADTVLALLLIVLSAVVQKGGRPYLAIAAFLVAPLLTLVLVRYQRGLRCV